MRGRRRRKFRRTAENGEAENAVCDGGAESVECNVAENEIGF